jgi:membrane peptidoglycan carboxypeptidase
MKLNCKNTRVRTIALTVLVVSSVLGIHLEKASRFELAALTPKPGVLVLDCQDRILRLGADGQGRRVILLPPGPLPEMIVAAFLAAEDSHFRQHHGVDLRAIGRAAWSNLKAGSSREPPPSRNSSPAWPIRRRGHIIINLWKCYAA